MEIIYKNYYIDEAVDNQKLYEALADAEIECDAYIEPDENGIYVEVPDIYLRKFEEIIAPFV